MEKLKPFLKLFNIALPFTDFLYILQLEEYSNKRLLRWLPRFFFRRNFQVRDQLAMTSRAIITLAVSFVIWVLVFIVGYLLLNNSLWLILLLAVALSLLTPFIVLLANTLVSLALEVPKKKSFEKAKRKIRQNKDMKVVVVAGSYGKTTVKNFTFQLVQYSYKTQMIPGNINTPLGIANWINNNLKENTELLIAEVDSYSIGEIAKSCDVLAADITVLTNIGDQHTERFGSEEKLAKALAEVFTHSKPQSIKITSQSTKDKIPSPAKHFDMIVIPDKSDSVTYEGKSLKVTHLSTSNQVNLQFALAIATQLTIQPTFILDTIASLELPERRQHQGEVLGYEGIDDSYNISFNTAQMGILTARALAKQKKKKLLVITAGIPELSKSNSDKNRRLGSTLDSEADFTIILGSMFAKEIASGFTQENKYRILPTLKDFTQDEAQNFKKEEWFLLFQPELNDLYY